MTKTKPADELLEDAMSAALGAATDLPDDVRRTLGLGDEPDPTPPKKRPATPTRTAGRPGTAGRCRVDVEALRRDSTHQLGHVIDEAIAFRLKRAVFEQKLTRGPWRTERAVIESALTRWLDCYEAGEMIERVA